MDPQIQTQIPTAGSQPADSSALDPQSVNLAKAIRQTESNGNFSAKGKSGEYGAYQWMPQTWSAMSQKAGVNVPLNQATPEQQNEVAYKQINAWKKEGYDPGQIASMWNSGDPNAYLGTFEDGDPSEGKNSQGVSYNVPKYAEQVSSTYQQLKKQSGQTDNQQLTQAPQNNSSGQPGWLQALEGLGLGAAGWVAGNIGNYAKEAAKDAVTDAAVGATVGSAVGPEGTAGGAVAGGLAGLVQPAVSGIIGSVLGGNNSQNSQSQSSGSSQSSVQPNQTTQQQEFPQSVAASQAVKNAINQTLQGTQANRVFSQSKAGQDAVNTAAQFGLIEADENGNLTYNADKQRELESAIENGKDSVIASQKQGSNSPVAVSNYAGSFIGSDRLNTAADKQKAAEIIQKEIGADSGGIPMNGQMSLEDMRKAQKTHYLAAKSSYNNPKPSADVLAHKALGNAYGKAIRDKIDAEDQPLFDRLTKMSQDLTRSKDIGKRLHGKAAPKERLGLFKSFSSKVLQVGAKAAEIYIGDALGGPIGAIIGSMAGEHINGKLEKAFKKNIFETKGMVAAMDILRDTKPKEYQRLIDALEKHGIKVKKDSAQDPTTKEGIVKDIQKDEAVMKRKKGLVDLPSSNGAKKGEREIGDEEIMQPGKTIRIDMKTGKKYVQV